MSAVLLAPFRLWMKTPFTFGPVIQTKVPLRITIFFWIIKILCTTIGESAADYLADTVGLGLPKTTLIMMGILIVSAAKLFVLSSGGVLRGRTGACAASPCEIFILPFTH